MKPIDYIYKNLDSFNISIFKQIVEESGEEVSESIYDYLMETTWNTNPALLRQFGLDIERSSEGGSESDSDVIAFPFTVKMNVSRKCEEGDYDYEPDTYNYFGTKSINKKWNPDVTSVKILVVDANGTSIEGSPFTYNKADDYDDMDEIYVGVHMGILSPIDITIDKTYEKNEPHLYEPGEWTFTITEV